MTDLCCVPEQSDACTTADATVPTASEVAEVSGRRAPHRGFAVRGDGRRENVGAREPVVRALTHTFACALPTRGSGCDCGALSPDHLR
jgi:hypothetical protein